MPDTVHSQPFDTGNGIKRLFRYLSGTADLGLFYPTNINDTLTGFADGGYLSDPHDGRSQTGYIFLVGLTAISWRSTKQTLVTTSSNHSEIIALYEASRECLWLCKIINHILIHTGKPQLLAPTTLFEDNLSYVTHIKNGYIKGERTKHIAPKFFFSHEQQGKDINVKWIQGDKNLADLMTKSLPPSTHQSLTSSIGMRSMHKLTQDNKEQGEK